MNIAHIDELDAIEMPDGFVWRPVRRRFEIRGFGVNVYTPGRSGRVVESHTEENLEHEEIYLVLRGRVRFTVGDDQHELGPGQLVFVRDPTLRRGAVALSDDAAVLALGGKPGQPFEISAWEAIFAALPYEQAEDWDAAIRIYEEALAERPDEPVLLQELARLKARAGR
jgi:quercetin dioxygenase-like cupin family protein